MLNALSTNVPRNSTRYDARSSSNRNWRTSCVYTRTHATHNHLVSHHLFAASFWLGRFEREEEQESIGHQ